MAFASDKGRQGAAGVSTGGYSIDNSLRFNDNDSAYLSRTPSSAGNRKTWTWSGWFKRSNLTTGQKFFSAGTADTNGTGIQVLGNAGLEDVVQFYTIIGGTDYGWNSTLKLRDTSAWYHLVFVYDASNSTGSDRMRAYVNSERITSFATNYGELPLNTDSFMNATNVHTIGKHQVNATTYLDGHLAEVNFVDGQALTPADFGETDATYGHWKAKAYEGTYGTNGFYLDFKNAGSLGNDASSNSNNWTPNNLAATDQMLDSPTNNFCTLNPLSTTSTAPNFLEGNLRINALSIGNGTVGTAATIVMPEGSGKWYAESCTVYVNNQSASFTLNNAQGAWSQNSAQAYQYGWGWQAHTSDPSSRVQSGGVNAYSQSAPTTGDVFQIAYDSDAGKIWFGRNNVWVSGNPSTATTPVYSGVTGDKVFNAYGYHYAGSRLDQVANFGQDSSFAGNKTAQGNSDDNGYGDFYYAPPTGFLALCTQNLPEPTVVPSEHFNTGLWTGNSGSQTAVSSWGFQADLLWTKVRSHVDSHIIRDIVRDGSTTMDASIRSNSTAAEYTSSGTLTTNSTGFSVSGHDGGEFNYNTYTYATWGWKANGAGVSNTNGTITSTVSANVDAGFSIVSYTGNGTSGATVGHGLSSAPEMVIVKSRSVVTNWAVQSVPLCNSVGNGAFLELNTTDTWQAGSNPRFNSTLPTSSVFSVRGYFGSSTNNNGDNFIAYCFHSVEGYSKVGSYTGNGSSDGTFVHCGFRPAYVMVKRTDASGSSWGIKDDARFPSNVMNGYLFAESSGAEGTATSLDIDFTSNGFKWRGTSSDGNASGGTYIYLAFAEVDFKHSNAR